MFESHLKPPIIFPTLTDSIVTFNSQYAGLPLKSHVVDIDYTGSAISGVHIQNTCGINQWDEQWEVGTYDASGQKAADNRMIRSKNYIAIKPNTTYYVLSANVAFVYFFYDIDKNFIGTNYLTNSTFTSPANVYYMNFRTSADYGNVYHNDISINYPSTDTTYHAFEGQSFNITFPTPIYGGQYDCLTGIVTSNKDSGGGDVSPTYQQTATANCVTNLGVNNIWADTGDTTLQYIKLG